MNYGYCNQALRINLSNNTIEKETLDPQFLYDYLGGGGITLQPFDEIVHAEVNR